VILNQQTDSGAISMPTLKQRESDVWDYTPTVARAAGETVVCVLPGHESEVDEFQCDRELVQRDAAWCVMAL
jgi:ATP phosphoribosyltransferase regulatory subunit